jgi:hypothetical protein
VPSIVGVSFGSIGFRVVDNPAVEKALAFFGIDAVRVLLD